MNENLHQNSSSFDCFRDVKGFSFSSLTKIVTVVFIGFLPRIFYSYIYQTDSSHVTDIYSSRL